MSSPIARLSNRSVVHVHGPDAQKLLHSLFSCDLSSPPPIQYGAALSPKGKFLFDFIQFHPKPDSFLFDIHLSRADAFIQHILSLRFRAKIIAEHRSDLIVAVNGPPPAFLPDPRSQHLPPRALIAQDNSLQDESETLRTTFLRLGIPNPSHDLVPLKHFPWEGNLDLLGAVSLTKGCYPGQEVVSRVARRGSIKKRMIPLTLIQSPTAPLPKIGDPLIQNNSPVGEIRSLAPPHALGVLRIDKTQPSLPLICGNSQFRVAPNTLLTLTKLFNINQTL